MANKKISSLTDLGISTSSEDLLHIVDYDSINGHVNKRITLAALFASIPSKLVLAGKSIISNVSQNIINNDVSYIRIESFTGTQSSPDVFTLPTTAVDGQLVNIVVNVDSYTSPNTVYNVVTASTGFCCGNTQVLFVGSGGTLSLLFDGLKWQILSSYNVTIT